MLKGALHKTLIMVSFMMALVVNAQNSSDQELEKKANELFNQKNYTEAKPLYSQLLSLNSRSPDYSYKYGVCTLHASRKKTEALKYLAFAAGKPNIDVLSFFYLARAYHFNYDFSAAEANYKRFKDKTTIKEHDKYQIDLQIEMCRNGKELMNSITDITVLSKKQIKSSDFFRSYELKGIGGKIIVKPEEFKSKQDKKSNETSIIYLESNSRTVIYSSYGNNMDNGKDLYRVTRLPSGKWDRPVNLGAIINTKYDEDYPFLHPDGKTLYFSSKGHNSMGGYDVFKSTLINAGTGEWSVPQNIEFAINSPDDDILYISDIDNKLAYFASSRASKEGEITVYKVEVERKPFGNSMIKGRFISETNPNSKSTTITVMSATTNTKYGIYKSDRSTGEYLLTFPKNGGKYKLLIETTNEAPIHSAVIDVPSLAKVRPLKQELRLVGVGDDEKLVVKNLFDETDEFDASNPLFIENIIRKKAQLDVEKYVDLPEDIMPEEEDKDEEVTNYSNLSDNQIIDKTEEKAIIIIKQSKESRSQANYTSQLVKEKNDKAKGLIVRSEKLMNEAKTISSEAEKQLKINEANKLKMEAAKLVNEVVTILNIASAIKKEAVDRESDIAEVDKIQSNIANEVIQGNRAKAESYLKKVDEISKTSHYSESTLEVKANLIKKKYNQKEASYRKARNTTVGLRRKKTEIEQNLKNLKTELGQTKKKKEQQELQDKISLLDIDVDEIQDEISKVQGKENEAKKEYIQAKEEYLITKNVIARINSQDINKPLPDNGKDIDLSTDLAYFEEKGMVGIYNYDQPITEESFSEINTEENLLAQTIPKEVDVNIQNESGDVIDYNAEFKKELENQNETSYEEKAEVHNKWVNAIEQELLIKKIERAEASDEEKETLNNDIKELEGQLEDQKDFIEIYKAKAAQTQEEVAENTTTNLKESSTETITPRNNDVISTEETTVSNEEIVGSNIDLTTYDSNVIDKDGEVKDYSSSYENKLKNADNITNEAERNIAKEKIAKEWISSIDEEIKYKNEELANVEGEKEMDIIRRLTILNIQKEEQQEAIVGYQKIATNESLTEETELAEEEREEETAAEEETNNYVPSSISLESTKEIAIARSIEQEAVDLEQEAEELKQRAEITKKKKTKKALIVEAEALEVKAKQKRKEAEVHYTRAEEMKQSESELIQDLAENRESINTEELTNEEGELVRNLKNAEVEEIKNKQEYKSYAEPKKELRRLIKEAQVDYIEADKLEKEANNGKITAGNLLEEANEMEDGDAKTTLIAQASELKQGAGMKNFRAKKLREEATQKEKKALSKSNEAKEIISNLDDELVQKIVAIEKAEVYSNDLLTEKSKIEEEPETEEPEIEEVVVQHKPTTIAEIDEIPQKLDQSIFLVVAKESAVYSEKKRIPVEPKLPEGLVFKVQIGAFKNPIPQDHFKGFAPIMAQKTGGGGLTRYTAGFFKTFDVANKAKSSIRSMGYSDAFVVSFLNGKRISVTEARKRLGDVKEQAKLAERKTPTVQKSPNEEVNDGISTDVRNIEGLFFTIQVGVYSKPVTATQLKNVSPLNSERTSNGYIRYTSGVYRSLSEANKAKEKIREMGISDAFVRAYNKGEGVSIDRASEIISSEKDSPKEELVERVEDTTEEIIEETPEPKEEVNTELEFKVKLGEYENGVPVEDAGIFLQLTGRGVKSLIENGKTIYTIGSFPDYQSALELKKEMKEIGVKNPIVVVYKEGKKLELLLNP